MTVDNVNTSHGRSLLNAAIPVPVPRGGCCVKNQSGTKSASRQWHHRGRKAGIIAKTDDVEVVQWQDSPELNAIRCNVLALCWFEGRTSNAWAVQDITKTLYEYRSTGRQRRNDTCHLNVERESTYARVNSAQLRFLSTFKKTEERQRTQHDAQWRHVHERRYRQQGDACVHQ